MKDSTKLRKGRLIQLDVLRGIAILLVLWFHPVVDPNRAGRLAILGKLGLHIGFSGVDLFFVLSGFLIGGLLFKEIKDYGKLNLPRFWIRRGLKIWPGYYALMLLVFAQLVRHQGAHSAVKTIWPSLVALQNYLQTVRGHIWSLAVEEHFYLLLPLLLTFLPIRRGSIPAIPILFIVVAILGLAFRVTLVYRHPDLEGARTDRTHLNIDGMFFGVFLAYLYHFHRDRFDRFSRIPGLFVLGLLLLTPMLMARPGTPLVVGIAHTTTYLAYGLILIALVQATPGQGFLGRLIATRFAAAIAFIGFYSYSIYLWFWDLAMGPMFFFLEHHGRRVPPELLWIGGNAAYIAVAVIVGVIMAKIIELPMLTLRNRLFPPRVTLIEQT